MILRDAADRLFHRAAVFPGHPAGERERQLIRLVRIKAFFHIKGRSPLFLLVHTALVPFLRLLPYMEMPFVSPDRNEHILHVVGALDAAIPVQLQPMVIQQDAFGYLRHHFILFQ